MRDREIDEQGKARGMPLIQQAGMSPIPWSIIEPHEEQAMKNHGQTLARLAYRGGLGVCEAVAILEDRAWHRMSENSAILRLTELIRQARYNLKGWKNGS